MTMRLFLRTHTFRIVLPSACLTIGIALQLAWR